MNFYYRLYVRLAAICISALSIGLGLPFFLGFSIVIILFAIFDALREIKSMDKTK